MESDGRIRSKDIGTGEVNSRALDNIRSSNFDGSHTDPENDPGSQGWQILKSGFMVINQAVVRGTISAARIIGAIISGGEVNITSGGSLTVGGDAETGVAPLVTLDESGLQVGTDVVMDATGLQVIGGYVTPSWREDRSDFVQDGSLNTTFTTKTSVTFTPPAWVQTLHVSISLFGQMTETTQKTLSFRLVGEGTGAGGVDVTVPAGMTNAASRTLHRSTTSFPATFAMEVRVESGTNALHRLEIAARAIGVRN